MFELLKVAIRTVVGHQNGRKTQETAFGIFFQAEMRTWSSSTGYTVEGDRFHAFFYIVTLYYSVTVKLKKFVRTCSLVSQTENFK